MLRNNVQSLTLQVKVALQMKGCTLCRTLRDSAIKFGAAANIPRGRRVEEISVNCCRTNPAHETHVPEVGTSAVPIYDNGYHYNRKYTCHC